MKLTSTKYADYSKNKPIHYTEIHLWYDNDCEECPCGWECRSYEGECDDCGCLISKDGDFTAPTIICAMPTWIKRLIMKIKQIKPCDEWV